MELKKLFLTFVALMAMFTSCVKFEGTFDNRIPTNTKGEYAILFSNPSPRTRATISSTSGTGYDEFSLFAWNSINDTIMNPYLVQADGVASYKYDGIGSQTLQYFKRASDWYGFIGIIPTSHSTELKNSTVKVTGLTSFIVDDKRVEQAVNLTDTLYWNTGLAVDSPEEFLWSYKRVEKANYGSTIELPFNHGNALVFLGFSSDRNDTKLIDYVPGTPDISAVPAHTDTLGYYFRLKYGTLVGTATNRAATNPIPDNLLNEIRSYYSIDNGQAGDFSAALNTKGAIAGNHSLRVVKTIPIGYKRSVNIPGTDKTFDFFDGFKYLKDNGCELSAANGSKPDAWDYILINLWKNDNGSYTAQTFNWSYSDAKPVYETVDIPETPAVPGIQALEGVRVFSADSTGVNNVPTDTLYCIHIPHTITADATIDANGCVLSNRVTIDDVIQFSLPATTTLSETPVWSPTTFYALPGDTNFNFIVVKLSYIYNGITTYDVRVPIHLPDGGLVPGKYYKYEIYITSIGNGTNDPDEARDEKDEILIEDNPVISVRLIDTGYTQGDEKTITI